ncbi:MULTISPECIES: 3-methyl-2-oxobutanoate hydroxymethyltransferase [unclassified Halorubrum]|uniref:3-methyl-2-oxobutanoate hydroxymethyltransferase n=1 Tax=unclassified Halorubrum TaxID=2642239 RepID=UPI000B980DF6|nr:MULTISPECIES: 3-methyl-2-oxobutanoate hydroxymethyltransferase [unclassified Halorubrum]OYR39619.1 3-methyl-2-oxobutanoate hydroxymethyltransferase [Halorubrum sp. Hd13]OYR41039.1 3-methyl-2-oxobutanoate hydroxymethyltransferase [Halorubrum sp. Eb13]OYR55393.1 3-methyl-2-oxobutanoate hydroxymethyltransferase [Halorubrum sp. Ea1]
MTTTRGLRDREAPITMLTAYDAPSAAVVDEAGVDVILVGDSMGNAVLGYDSTLPVTLDEIASRTAAVARATADALVVADMPFLSFGVEPAESVRNAGRLLKEADADAVKIESGPHTVEMTRRMTEVGIPVMAHLGLTPQHVNRLGGYARQGTDQDAAEEIVDLAGAHAEAGAFALVLEHVPANLAGAVTEALEVPTIGIGAGPDCDGQVLVINDAVGLGDWSPPFSRQFGDVRGEMLDAVTAYREAVESGEFPADEHWHVEEELDDLY